MASSARPFWSVVCLIVATACGFPRPADVGSDSGAVLDTNTADAKPHYVEPRYLPDICDSAASMPVFTAGNAPFSTSLDANCTGGVVAQSNGPEICVVRYGSIRLATDVTLT